MSSLLDMFGEDEVDVTEVAAFCLFAYSAISEVAWPGMDVIDIAEKYLRETFKE